MIAVTESELSACEFRHWFPLFSSSKITFPSRIIHLPSAFVHYLESDGIKLPAGLDGREASALSDDEDLVEVLSKEAAEEDVSFSQLNEEIRVFMRELGGEVFIKLNWSCPSDAVWMNGGSLRCTRLEEVYLLLKSSDRILFDLNHTILPSAAPSPSIEAENASSSSRPSPPRHSMDHTLSSSPFTLILRKWRRDLPSSMEFRCFVLHRSLVAVSQRDCSSFFPFLPAEKQRVLSLVVPFFKNHIVSNFPLESCIQIFFFNYLTFI